MTPNLSAINERLDIKYLSKTTNKEIVDNGEEVIQGLTQTPKTLPARYFYDAKGSLLFEEICQLTEYYPTRTEAAILKQYATEIAKQTGHCELIELGSGSSTKTRFLLDAYHQSNLPTYYSPIDVSKTILEASAKQLLTDYSQLKIRGQVGTYAQALDCELDRLLERRMVIFLGSSLGNFSITECDRFLKQIHSFLYSGDYFLLGIDLQKPVSILEAAYNDDRGVTAAFNLNMLSHLNNLFNGNFNLDLFEHQAIYNLDKNQIEMYLTARKSHSVFLEKLSLVVNFERQEAIRTEISRKFNVQQIQQQLDTIGLKFIQSWTDENNWFGLLLCQKK